MHVGTILIGWIVTAVIVVIALVKSGILKIDIIVEDEDDPDDEDSSNNK